MQRSKYVCIDNDIDDAKKFTSQAEKRAVSGPQSIQPRDIVNNINIKFCPPAEVGKNKKHFLLFRSTFSTKLHHIKLQGKKLELMKKILGWINFEDDESASK